MKLPSVFGGGRSRTTGARWRARIGADEEGQALAELAAAVAVFMLIFTGIVTFAIAYSNKITLTQAVGAGGEYLQDLRTSTTDPCADTLSAIEQAAPTLTGSKISLTLTMDGVSVSGSSCPGDESDLVQGEPITVEATYPCNLMIVDAFKGSSFSSACQLSAQVTEYEY
ncbi:MAG TPA: TadE/TadG family type IV pilus assembly protein [Terracidiphilus sp.]|nr:TadE/TadG family type IV pilus assembly protein [Terracidiphilus sp.]